MIETSFKRYYRIRIPFLISLFDLIHVTHLKHKSPKFFTTVRNCK
uniref:Uncharacterized protein n=1 Tax=Lepeophtheirus salmonis TaxID=72036 RepID=A0A0K2TUA5_LEPSM